MTRSEYFATADDLAGRLWIPCGCGVSVSFMLHHDAKTAPGVRVEPSGRAVAVVANAFPLPAGPLDVGGSCPGATSECRNCYAAGLESWAPPAASNPLTNGRDPGNDSTDWNDGLVKDKSLEFPAVTVHLYAPACNNSWDPNAMTRFRPDQWCAWPLLLSSLLRFQGPRVGVASSGRR